MPHCRPGDLAVVISASNPGNLGRIVWVVCVHDGKGALSMPKAKGTVWLVEDAGGRLMTWTSAKSGRRWRRKRGPVPDSQLQPIRAVGEQGVEPVARTAQARVPALLA